jgi:hypothetical protein
MVLADARRRPAFEGISSGLHAFVVSLDPA